MSDERDIGEIANYYGGLSVCKDDGKFYWGIKDWNGIGYEEIPESLYIALTEYQDNLESKANNNEN